jgi:DivIVA domain-containing protein
VGARSVKPAVRGAGGCQARRPGGTLLVAMTAPGDGLTPDDVRVRRFSWARAGYRRREVERFLARAADDLARLLDGADRGTEPPLTPGDVDEVRFHKAIHGYAMLEVDDFLDEVAAALGRARQARAAAARPVAQLPPPPRPGLTAAEVATTTFPRGIRGYAPGEVDAFLATVAGHLARLEAGQPAEPPLTRADVQYRHFTLGPRGYEMHEVDVFLARLAAQFPAGPGQVLR